MAMVWGPVGLGFESGALEESNPFHFREFYESKPPTRPKPSIYHLLGYGSLSLNKNTKPSQIQ